MIFVSNNNMLLYFLVPSFLFLIAFYLSVSNIKQRSTSKRQIRHPPSPLALPLIGHLHLLSPALSKSLQALAARHGPLMYLRLGSKNTVNIVSNATIANEMLKDNDMNFVSRPELELTEYNIYGAYTFIFAEYGPFWRFMKKLSMTELLSMSQVNRFADIRREETMKLLGTFVKCSEQGKACDVGVHLLTLTKNVIWRMAFNTTCTGSDEERRLVWEIVKGIQELSLKFMMTELLGPFNRLDLFGHGKRLKSLLMKFDDLIEKIMAERENDHDKNKSGGEKQRKDIMYLLLEIYRDENADVKLSRTHIKTFLLEMFVGCTDTTSAAVQWAIAELINHPQSFHKLREEIDNVIGSTRLVEESDIPNLPYMQAVVKETLRLHPSASVMFRKCVKDCKINGYDVLANERVIFNLQAIMRDPNSWENPLDFVPERFMTTDFESGRYDHYRMDMKGQNFRNFPFGSGRRVCPGASLALAVIHEAVAKVVQCFDFEVPNGGEFEHGRSCRVY